MPLPDGRLRAAEEASPMSFWIPENLGVRRQRHAPAALVASSVYYIYIEIRVCPRLGAARADPPLSRMYPQGQCCLGADLVGTTPTPKTDPSWHYPLQRPPSNGGPEETERA